jgi:hypothetical protein
LKPNAPHYRRFKTIKVIEATLAGPAVILNSFIASPTLHKIIPMRGMGMTKAELQECHVLFHKDDKETYIKALLEKVVTT